MVARGDIWLVELESTVGSEINKTRPCVVISPPEIHDHLRTIIVVPMTSKGASAPFRIPVLFKRKRGLILCDQIRTVDKRRLVRREGAVSGKTLIDTLRTLQEVFTV